MLFGITVGATGDPEITKAEIGYYVNGVAQTNRLLMRAQRIPPLYRSGLTYRVEPWAANLQSLNNCLEALERRWLECKTAAAWRLAELRELAGSEEHARQYDLKVSYRDLERDPLAVGLQPQSGIVRVFHVVVLLPSGETEDPTKRLRRA